MSDEKREAIKSDLREARQVLLTAVSNMQPDEWTIPVYSEGATWSILDIVRHLAGAQAGMTDLMRGIRKGSGGVPEDFDLARWNQSRIQKQEEKSPDDLFAALAQGQADLFAFMDDLDEADWQKKGRHPVKKIMSIEEICRINGDHERLHAKDVANARAAQ